MVALTIDTSDIDDMARRYATIAPVMEREMRTAMIRATAQVQHDAMTLVPVLTGHLRRSITTDPQPYEGRVGTNVVYARVVEEGFPPARPGLKGRKAKPYLVPALEQNRPAINREFTAAIGRVLTELSRAA